MSLTDKAEIALKNDGWTCKEVKYTAYAHTTRLGWSHPSKVFKRPVSFEKAWDFFIKYHSYNEWHYDNQSWN